MATTNKRFRLSDDPLEVEKERASKRRVDEPLHRTRGRVLASDDLAVVEWKKRCRADYEEETLVPAFIPNENVDMAELQRRASEIIVPPPFTRTHEEFTPENCTLASYLHYNNFASTYIRAYDGLVSNELRKQYSEISFTVGGVQYNFVNLRFGLPRHPTMPSKLLYPSFSRECREASYTATEYLVLRLTDSAGHSRDIQVNMGRFPVMLGSVLCNLHPSNWSYENDQPPKVMLKPIVSNNIPLELTDREKAIRNQFYRRHNESTTDQVPYFVMAGSEQVGVSYDKQRNSVIQLVSLRGRRPYMRFIATVTKTSNLIVFFNDLKFKPGETIRRPEKPHKKKNAAESRKKPGRPIPSLQLHVSDFMRNNMDENYVTLLVPFFVAGWSYERILEELRHLVPADEYIWQRVKLELAVCKQELDLVLELCGGSVYEYLRLEMRDKGRNPMTGRAFTEAQVNRLLFEHMFRHMNVFYPRTGWDTAAHRSTHDAKLRLLLLMVADLLMHIMGVIPPVNRDSWSRKKLVTIVRQLQNLHMRHLNEVRRQWIKWATAEPIGDIMALNVEAYAEKVHAKFNITTTFELSMTGKSWGVSLPVNGICKPVATKCHEKLRRDSLYSAVSQGNRTTKDVNPQVKDAKTRDHDPLGEGVICGLETPDGSRIGHAEHKAITAQITTQVDDSSIRSILKARKCLRDQPDVEYNTIVLLNGKFMNWGKRTLEFELRRLKRLGVIDIFTAIAYVEEPRPVLEIGTDEGRLMFPAMVVDEASGEVLADKILPGETDFQTLLRAGCIEFIDPRERRNGLHFTYDRKDLVKRTREMVRTMQQSQQRVQTAEKTLDSRSWRSIAHLALCRRHHAELKRHSRVGYVHMDPSVQLGVIASLAPFVQHCYAVRAGFVAGMYKQAIGNAVSNSLFRTDVCARTLWYGARPGYRTVAGEAMGGQAYHTTQLNVIITCDPYTQEDSLFFNKKAADAGAGSFTTLKRITKRKEAEEEEHVRLGIAPSKRAFRRKYRNIMDSGLPRRNSVVRQGEVLVAMTAHGTQAADFHMPHGECGIVDSVQLLRDGTTDLRRVIVIIREHHCTVEGTKKCNTQGQKATVGNIVDEVDMMQIYGHPERIVQLGVNPIGFAGRVTAASIPELLYSNYGISARRMNATSFANYNPEHIERDLIEHGYRPNGMYKILLPSGHIAEQRAFFGRMAYMEINQIPGEKAHVRTGDGPREITTNQPTQGRSGNGGLRFSIMEIAQLMNHGCSAQLIERLMLHSDARTFIYCRDCQMRYDTMFFRGSRCRGCMGQNFYKVVHPEVLRYLEELLAVPMVDFRLNFYFPK